MLSSFLNASLKSFRSPSPIPKVEEDEEARFTFIQETGHGTAGPLTDETQTAKTQIKRHEQARRPKRFRFVQVEAKQLAEQVSSRKSKDDEDDDAEEVSRPESNTNRRMVRRKDGRLFLPPELVKTGYEKARIDFDIDVSLLSGLTATHLGKGRALVSDDMGMDLGPWLKEGQRPSYLDLVPSYYSSSPLLQTVVKSTMARYSRAVNQQSRVTEATVLKLYGKSLSMLQSAIASPQRAKQPDVMLAAAIMQLYEILSNHNNDNLARHTLGLAKLFEMRDPDAFTKVERSVLTCQLGPILTEYDVLQEDCFFEAPKWKQAIKAALGDATLMVPLKFPRFLRVCKDFIMPEELTRSIEEKVDILKELRQAQAELDMVEEKLRQMVSINPGYIGLMHIPWSCQVQLYHMIMALDPMADDAKALEEQSNELSDKLLAGGGGWTIPIELARLSKDYREDWWRAVEGWEGYVNVGRGVVSKMVWQRWSDAMLYKPPTTKWVLWKK